MARNENYLSEIKSRNAFDSRYEKATLEELQKESLYLQKVQTDNLVSINKNIKTVLTIIIVLIVLYVVGTISQYIILNKFL